MPEHEIYETLTPIFRDVFVRDDLVLRPDLTAKDIADWDSFKQIEIIIAVEQQFGIKFRTQEMDNLASVGDLARLIADKS